MQPWKKALAFVTGIIFVLAVVADRIDAVLDLPANLRTVMGVVGVIFSLSEGALLFLVVGVAALVVAASDLWMPYITQSKTEPKLKIKTRNVSLLDLAREQGLSVGAEKSDGEKKPSLAELAKEMGLPAGSGDHKLGLELPKGSEDQRFIDTRFSGAVHQLDLLIAVVNNDPSVTVDDVRATVVSYGLRDQPSGRFALGVEMDTAAHANRNVHPRSRLLFKIGTLEDDGTDPGNPMRRFWLGGIEKGRRLEYGVYAIKVAYSGRNHPEVSEKFELRFSQTSIGIGPKVIL